MGKTKKYQNLVMQLIFDANCLHRHCFSVMVKVVNESADVLDCRNQVVLNSLVSQATPSSSLESMIVRSICKTSFH